MMNAYNHNKEYNKTISLYQQDNREHNHISNTLVIKACSSIGDYDKGKELINSNIGNIKS